MNNSSQGYCATVSTAPRKMSRASIAYAWLNARQRAVQQEMSHHNNAHSKVVSLAMLATIMSLIVIWYNIARNECECQLGRVACQLETSCYGFRNFLLHFLITHINQSLNGQPEVKAHYTKSVIWRLVEPVYQRNTVWWSYREEHYYSFTKRDRFTF